MLKPGTLVDRFPSDSIFAADGDSLGQDLQTDLRVVFAADRGPWRLHGDWQLIAEQGDRVARTTQASFGLLPGIGVALSDRRRQFNLTDNITTRDRFRAVHRLDRMSIGYSAANWVVRAGRQALSWGNGLVFAPLDIVNPFDPTAIDTEYKVGDDMLYGQYLLPGGDDLQFAHVFRRNPIDRSSSPDHATTAIKYHGVRETAEFDILLARNYDQTTIGIGGNRSIGGAIWRADVVYANTSAGSRFQLVTNLSYSWTWRDRNVSGVVEYFHSGFGQRDGRYTANDFQSNPELVSRIARGELFTVGRNYVAGGLTIEVTPLWVMTPNLFTNVDDGSALFQLGSRYSVSDNAEFLSAISVPLGPGDTEYGGLPVGVGNTFFSTDWSLFAQFAWYF